MMQCILAVFAVILICLTHTRYEINEAIIFYLIFFLLGGFIQLVIWFSGYNLEIGEVEPMED
jgi:hypothetical protein